MAFGIAYAAAPPRLFLPKTHTAITTPKTKARIRKKVCAVWQSTACRLATTSSSPSAASATHAGEAEADCSTALSTSNSTERTAPTTTDLWLMTSEPKWAACTGFHQRRPPRGHRLQRRQLHVKLPQQSRRIPGRPRRRGTDKANSEINRHSHIKK